MLRPELSIFVGNTKCFSAPFPISALNLSDTLAVLQRLVLFLALHDPKCILPEAVSQCASKLGNALNNPSQNVKPSRALEIIASCRRNVLSSSSIAARTYAEGQERAIVVFAQVTHRSHDFVRTLERVSHEDAKPLFLLAADRVERSDVLKKYIDDYITDAAVQG